jgi:hypothetical protein
MASLSTSGDSADSNSDILSTSSEESHNSQDTNSSQTSDDLEEDIALMELDEALEIMPERQARVQLSSFLVIYVI